MPTTIHKLRIAKLRKAISSEEPEMLALKLARYGAKPPQSSPSNRDFKNVLTAINAGEPQIIFPWFWRHDDVTIFKEKFSGQIDQSQLFKLISEIAHIMDSSETHWSERVNLFHLFGVSRLFEETDKNVLKLQDTYRKEFRYGLVAVSALNANYLSKHADSKDASYIIKSLKEAQLAKSYAEYQLFYYRGFDNFVDSLEKYIGTFKEIMIPPSIWSIEKTFKLDSRHETELQDKVVARLPKSARKLILDK